MPASDRHKTYTDWITGWLSEHKAYGRCAEATLEMREAFPELTRVPGYVMDSFWGKRDHWWLTSPDGTIVDPTVSQFPCPLEYIPHREGDPVRLGKCMNCGEYIWGLPGSGIDTACCSTACATELNESFNEHLR